MVGETYPNTHETYASHASDAISSASENDELLCLRTNLIQMVQGDELSKELVGGLLELNGNGLGLVACPVGECGVQYELRSEDGSYKRRMGDCAVISGRISEAAKNGNRGMTFAEFAQTPTGRKLIK